MSETTNRYCKRHTKCRCPTHCSGSTLLLCNVQIFRCLHRHLLKFDSLQCCVASAACTGIYSAQSIAATTVDPAFCGSDLPHGFGGPRSERFWQVFHDQWQFQHHMLQLQCCGFQCVTCFNVSFLWGFSTRPTLCHPRVVKPHFPASPYVVPINLERYRGDSQLTCHAQNVQPYGGAKPSA